MSNDIADRISPKDHTLAAVKAAFNLLPGIGGAIASLIADYVPSSRQQAVEKAMEFLVEKLSAIESRIDPRGIAKEEFADLFAKFERLAASTNREEKLRAAANILANSLLPLSDPSRSPFDELDHLMHCVDALSGGAIAMLGASIQIREPRHASQGDTPFSFAELRRKLSNFDPDLILGLAAELHSMHLLHIREGTIFGHDYEHYQFRVTPLGSRFAQRFIEGRM